MMLLFDAHFSGREKLPADALWGHKRRVFIKTGGGRRTMATKEPNRHEKKRGPHVPRRPAKKCFCESGAVMSTKTIRQVKTMLQLPLDWTCVRLSAAYSYVSDAWPSLGPRQQGGQVGTQSMKGQFDDETRCSDA